MRLGSLLLVTWLFTSCATTPPATTAPLATRELTLQPDEVNERDGLVLFEPDSAVQRAHYDMYQFAAADFRARFPQLTAPVTVTVAIDGVAEQQLPTEPGAPSPAGGIRRTVYRVHLISR